MDAGEGKSLVGEIERARSGRERATQKVSHSQSARHNTETTSKRMKEFHFQLQLPARGID